MKRTYTDQEMIRILKQELVIPDKVDQGKTGHQEERQNFLCQKA